MKKTRQWSEKDLLQLDAWEFARFGGKVESASSIAQFSRLLADLHDEARSDPRSFGVKWAVFGVMDTSAQCFLGLEGAFCASVPCMRCSAPVSGNFEFKRLLRLCKSEQEADTTDLEEEIDPVVASGKVNVLEWLEDELMLSLPMFPSHEVCAEDKTADSFVPNAFFESDSQVLAESVTDAEISASEESSTDEAPKTHRPFEILARLKKPGSV